jgi:hypothetical protein
MNRSEELIACLEREVVARDALIAELEAWKAEEMQVMSPLMDYARKVCTGQLGCMLADWLVSDHKKLRAELARVVQADAHYQPEALRIASELASLREQVPVAYILADAVGGSALEFQRHELYDSQRRYGGHIEPLYAAPVAKQVVMPDVRELLEYTRAVRVVAIQRKIDAMLAAAPAPGDSQ